MIDGSTSFTFTTPGRIVVGWGAATDGRLASEAARLGKRPLIVTGGHSLRRSGALEVLLASFIQAGLAPVTLEGVPPEPDIADVEACRLAAADCDCVVAIGGGSVLDVAKGAAALSGHPSSVRDFFEGRVPVPEAAGKPILAVPTTAGTGSEVTWVGVYGDRESRRKSSIRGPSLMPATALLDAELTTTCSASVTAHSGMDAFVQAVESFTSVTATPLTDALALEAARLASYKNVAAAAASPNDRATRENVALGSLMAGMALNTSRLGLVHGLAAPIGAVTGAPHGLICAMLLLPVMRFNRSVTLEKYATVARTLLGPGATDNACLDALMRELEITLRDNLSLPARLSEIGFAEADIDAVAVESMSSGSTKANPRPVSVTDAAEVLRGCF